MDGVGDVLVIKGGIYASILQAVKDKLVVGQKSDILYLVLDTNGGSPEIGFRTMRLLGSQYARINVLVPDRAMSTGTLMALGGDKIYMFHSSSLGPLDLQIEHPNDGSRISTIDVRDTWTTILAIAESVATRTFNTALYDHDLNKESASRQAFEHSANFVKPIVDKIDPYHLHSSYRSSSVGAKYATTLLRSRMMKNSPAQAKKVSTHLANDYESHGSAITLEEARDELGLAAEDISNLDRWAEIEVAYANSPIGVQLTYIKKSKSQKQTDEASKDKGGDDE